MAHTTSTNWQSFVLICNDCLLRGRFQAYLKNKHFPLTPKDQSDQPDQLDQSDQPDQPDHPDQPNRPDQPDQLDQADQPDQPNRPDQPDQPDQLFFAAIDLLRGTEKHNLSLTEFRLNFFNTAKHKKPVPPSVFQTGTVAFRGFR